MKYVALLATVLVGVVGCNQNPYNQPGIPLTDQPKEKVILPPYSIQTPDQLVFEEGKETRHSIVGQVTEGQAILMFKDLPQGATFDAATNELIWTPGYDVADDAQNPAVTRKFIPIKVAVTSSASPSTRLEKSVTLVVLDTPQPIDFELANSGFAEGIQNATTLTIKDANTPDGPFQVIANLLPAGVSISPTNDPKTFQVLYQPGPETVVRDSSEILRMDIKVINARGYTQQKNLPITVYNKLIPTIVSMPKDVTTNTDLSYEVTVVDPNDEQYPTVTLLRRPSIGTVDIVLLRSTSTPLYSRTYNVSWSNIPLNRSMIEEIVIRSCVNSRYTSPSELCTDHKTKIFVSNEGRTPPDIDRSDWKLGETKYYKQGNSLNVLIPITKTTSGPLHMDVRVEPAALAPFISVNSQQTAVNIQTPGVHQFDIIASVGAASRKESFIVEVLPADWSENLFVGGTKDSQDLLGLKTLLSSLRMVVPSLYPLDQRTMVERKGIFLGPDAIATGEAESALATISKGPIEKIFVYGTNLDQLPESYKTAIRGFNLEIAAKAPITSPTASNPVVVGAQSRLKSPVGPVFLKGQVPAAYTEVTTLTLGSAACTSLLEMKVEGAAANSVIAAMCPSTNRIFIVAGFHWADLGFDAAQDPNLVKTWLEGMLNR